MFVSTVSLGAIGIALVAIAGASPVVQPLGNLTVITRKHDFSYSQDAEMTEKVRRRLIEAGAHHDIEKRSYATIQTCKDQSCTDCTLAMDGYFDSFTCLSAVNTVCLIVSSLQDAHVSFWNHESCNGNESNYYGCDHLATDVGAPGTNSLGANIGC